MFIYFVSFVYFIYFVYFVCFVYFVYSATLLLGAYCTSPSELTGCWRSTLALLLTLLVIRVRRPAARTSPPPH